MRLPFALLTIVEAKGTVSRRSGRMAVSKDGEKAGTIGGGAHEAEAVEAALDAIKTGQGEKKRIKVRDKGEIEVMIDIPIQDRSLVIIGAGHVGQALYEMFYRLKWHVTVLDSRK